MFISKTKLTFYRETILIVLFLSLLSLITIVNVELKLECSGKKKTKVEVVH